MKELNLDDLDVVGGGVMLHGLGLAGGSAAGSDFINAHLQQSASGAGSGLSSMVGDLLNMPVIGQAITGLMHSFEGSGGANGLGQIVSQLGPVISAFTGGTQGANGALGGLNNIVGALGPLLNNLTHGSNGNGTL